MASRSLNKVMLIGNLTRDPELRYTTNNTPIATFGVATNREYTPSNRTESIEETEFHNIVVWSKLAELCDKLLAKGQKVYIEGRLQTRNWDDEATGKKTYRTEIIAGEMIVLSPPKDREREHQSETRPNADAKSESVVPTTNPAVPDSGAEETIPF